MDWLAINSKSWSVMGGGVAAHGGSIEGVEVISGEFSER